MLIVLLDFHKLSLLIGILLVIYDYESLAFETRNQYIQLTSRQLIYHQPTHKKQFGRRIEIKNEKKIF